MMQKKQDTGASDRIGSLQHLSRHSVQFPDPCLFTLPHTTPTTIGKTPRTGQVPLLHFPGSNLLATASPKDSAISQQAFRPHPSQPRKTDSADSSPKCNVTRTDKCTSAMASCHQVEAVRFRLFSSAGNRRLAARVISSKENP